MPLTPGFAAPFPVSLPRCLQNTSTRPHQVARHSRRPAHLLRACIEEADWVIVDVSLRGLSTDAHLHATQLEHDGRDLVRYAMKNQPAELSIMLCSDDEIEKLNHDYRDKSRPTDVLSFPQNDDVILGDVIISMTTAQKQAEEQMTSLRDELRVLLVHGLLHLMGYDHEKSDIDFRLMAEAEQRMLGNMHWSGEGLTSRAATT